MADDIATETSAQSDQLEQLREEIKESYQQNGVSDKTRQLLASYVDKLVQAGLEVSSSGTSGRTVIEDVVASLDLGVSDQAILTAIAKQLEDLAAGKHCAGGGPCQGNVAKAADPVEMFSGQFTHEVTDLVIRGAGMDFELRRIYKNQVVYFGPLGANWDHTYNLHIRQQGNDLLRSSGELRDDLYTRHPQFGQAGFDYWVPPDGEHGAIEANGTSFVHRSPGGTRCSYRQDASDPLFHRIEAIRDRFGNSLAFRYRDDLLERIDVNHQDRFVLFDHDTSGRIIAVRDHTGRQWTYDYDDYGDLVSVTSPKTSRYPGGLTMTYEYSSSTFTAPLQHNLIAIVDPADQLYLENEYGTSPGLLDFNRVVRQRQGSGEYTFEYERVVEEFEFDYNPSEKPAIQVNQTLRNGQRVHLIYNAFGNILFREEYIEQEGRRRLIRWRYRYNRDGALIGTITPEGSVVQYLHGRDDYLRAHGIDDEDVSTHASLTAAARMAFGNLLAIVRRGRRYDLAQMSLNRGVWGDLFPDVLGALDPEDVVVKSTYEPDYQQVLTVSDARFTARADPRHPEGPSYGQHLTRYEYSALPLKALSRIRYPDTTFPAPLANGSTGLANVSDEYLQYDPRGRLERSRDPEGNITEYRYFQPGAGDPATEGFLDAVVRDAGHLNLTTTFRVNAVGLTTSHVNPRMVETRTSVNELDQTVETISGGPGFRSRFFFDRNGLLERQERDNVDELGQPSPDGDEVRTYRHDEQGNLVRETRGGTDLLKHHVMRHRHDSSDQRIETILPAGNRVRFAYDERSLRKAATRGSGSGVSSTTRCVYDGDGRKIATVDGRGYVTRFEYDALGRLVSTSDPLGHVRQTRYDKLGNATVTRLFERAAGGSYQLLKRSELEYDERSNRIREIQYLFQSPIPTADIRTAPDAAFLAASTQGMVTAIEQQLFYDRNKRLFQHVNAKGQATTYEYDGANRPVLERDSAGNYVRTFHDANSNVVRLDRHELVRDPLTGAILREDVFSTVNEYDLLDRLVARTDGLGNRITFTYDSRNNRTSMTDALGNVIRSTYDVFGRKARVVAEMTDSGVGGGLHLPDVVTRFVFDENDRLRSVFNPRGTETRFSYDELDRLVQTSYADGSSSLVGYDPDDNVIRQKDNNGLQILYRIDPLSRRTRVDLDETELDPRFPYPVGAERYERYDHDGAGRISSEENDYCRTTRQVDSLDRVHEERIEPTSPFPGPGSPLTIGRVFDVLSNRTEVTYPGGRTIRYDYDELNRIARISNAARGTGYPGSTTFPVQYDIGRYQYRGLRLARVIHGNQTSCELALDGEGRLIDIRHLAGASPALELQQLSDAAGNRRFQSEFPAAGAPNGERYGYDSLYRMVAHERTVVAPINIAQFEPPAAPLLTAAMTGQQQIDSAIGPLVQGPAVRTYQYDSAGNREREQPAGLPAIVYAPNPLDEYLSVDGTPYQYDLNGNLIDDGSRLYRYNYRNQLVQVVQKAGNVELSRQLYDAAGRLVVLREAGAQAVLLIHDGLNVIEEYDGGNISRQYVYENQVDQRCQMATSGNEWWYHCDLLRSTRLLSDASGQIPATACFQYDPFGRVAGVVSHENPFLFGGKRLLRIIGLYDSRARQYSPVLGRFLQRDPKGLSDGLNLFAYAGNNPVNFVDPLGTEKNTPGGVGTLARTADDNLDWIRKVGESGDWSKDYNNLTLERRAIYNLITHSSGRDRSADEFRPLSEFYSSYQQAIDEPVFGGWLPGSTAGWLIGELYTGTTISDRKIDRSQHLINIPLSLAEDWAKMELLVGGSRVLATGGRQLASKIAFKPKWKFGPVPPGALGVASDVGEITIRRGLSRRDFVETLRHETVHAFFSPRGGPWRAVRGKVGKWGYDNSHLIHFLEEGLAETYGTRSLSRGFGYASSLNLSAGRIAGEGVAYIGGTAGLGYGGYKLSEKLKLFENE